MATELFVSRRCHILVTEMGLTLSNTEEELKVAIQEAMEHGAWSSREIVVSEEFTFPAGRRIFPTHGYSQEYQDGELVWVKSHEFGTGSNENPEWILAVVKNIVMNRAGIDSWRFSWL